MTTPAQNQKDTIRSDYREVVVRVDRPEVIQGNRSRNQRGMLRLRPQSSPSPVREDGSRAPKGWQNRWFTFIGLPKKVDAVTGAQYGRLYNVSYPDGITTAIMWPNHTVETYSAALFQQARFTWLDGGSLREFPPAVSAVAVTRLRNAIAEGEATLGVTLGEFRETAGFLWSLASGVEKTFNTLADKSPKELLRDWKNFNAEQLREAKRKRTREVLYRGRVDRRLRRESRNARKRRLQAEESILRAWLTHQFAVIPLINDLHSAARSLSYWQFDRGNPMRLTVKKGASDTWTERYSLSEGVGASWYAGKIVSSYEVECGASEHWSMVLEVPPGTDRDLQRLGLTNPGADLYELVRFSWLLDYAIGIGAWLRSMTNLEHIDFVEGSRSRLGKIRTTTGEVSVQPDRSHANTVGASGSGRIMIDGGRFERTVVTKIPMPAAFPAFKKTIGVNQVANALAALARTSGNPNLRD